MNKPPNHHRFLQTWILRLSIALIAVSSAVSYAGVIDLPPGNQFSQQIAANDSTFGNIWTGVAQSFTAEDPFITFAFYGYTNNSTSDSVLLSLYAGDGLFTTPLDQQMFAFAAGSPGSQLIVADFSAVALVPSGLYTVVASLPTMALPPSGTTTNFGIQYAQTDATPDPYSDGRFYFTGSPYDMSNPAFSTRDIAFQVTPVPEPNTGLLVGFSVLILLASARRVIRPNQTVQ